MDYIERMQNSIDRLPASVRESLEGFLKAVPIEAALHKMPFVRGWLEHEYTAMLKGVGTSKSAAERKHRRLPEFGIPQDDLLERIRTSADEERKSWEDGFVSGAVYHGGKDHNAFLNEVHSLTAQTNPLHSDLWPSIARYEAEIIAMAGDLMNAPGDETFGCVTSGGTESILLAMKTYRDRARAKGIVNPNIIVPSTAHAAFDKACQYFNIRKITVPVNSDFVADVNKMARAIDPNTIAMVGSAPAFPHGTIDPIPDLAGFALQRGIGFHTDACLGGFILPFASHRYPIPAYDFRSPGVTSISLDTHKYGYATKGTSVVLYRTAELRRFQYYATTDWPGGLYFSPTLAGSRPGSHSAECWAAMLSLGREGYREAAQKILATADWIKSEIGAIDDLFILGKPLWVIAIGSKTLNIYDILSAMADRGWNLNGLHRPPCLHLCVTLPHTLPGVADRFIDDLTKSVKAVQARPHAKKHGLAPIYGMGGTLPARGLVSEVLKRYLDQLYRL